MSNRLLVCVLLAATACKCSPASTPAPAEDPASAPAAEHLPLNPPDAGSAFREPLTAEQRTKLRECLTAYFKGQQLNEYGESLDSEYEAGEPLITEQGNPIQYEEYIFVHNRDVLEQCPVERPARTAPDVRGGPPPYPVNLSPEQVKQIDDCLRAEFAKEGLNAFGDAPDTEYEGGTPLRDPHGNPVLLREYVFVHHPEITARCPGPAKGAGYGSDIPSGPGSEKPFYPDLTPDQAGEVEACIQKQLAEAGLNTFGDAPNTTYDGGSPLPKCADGTVQPIREYVHRRHPEITLRCPPPAEAIAAAVAKGLIEPYPPNLAPGQVEQIDTCLRKELKGLGLNEYGDPVGTEYTGGSPLIRPGNPAPLPLRDYVFRKRPEVVAKCPAPPPPPGHPADEPGQQKKGEDKRGEGKNGEDGPGAVKADSVTPDAVKKPDAAKKPDAVKKPDAAKKPDAVKKSDAKDKPSK